MATRGGDYRGSASFRCRLVEGAPVGTGGPCRGPVALSLCARCLRVPPSLPPADDRMLVDSVAGALRSRVADRLLHKPIVSAWAIVGDSHRRSDRLRSGVRRAAWGSSGRSSLLARNGLCFFLPSLVPHAMCGRPAVAMPRGEPMAAPRETSTRARADRPAGRSRHSEREASPTPARCATPGRSQAIRAGQEAPLRGGSGAPSRRALELPRGSSLELASGGGSYRARIISVPGPVALRGEEHQPHPAVGAGWRSVAPRGLASSRSDDPRRVSEASHSHSSATLDASNGRACGRDEETPTRRRWAINPLSWRHQSLAVLRQSRTSKRASGFQACLRRGSSLARSCRCGTAMAWNRTLTSPEGPTQFDLSRCLPDTCRALNHSVASWSGPRTVREDAWRCRCRTRNDPADRGAWAAEAVRRPRGPRRDRLRGGPATVFWALGPNGAGKSDGPSASSRRSWSPTGAPRRCRRVRRRSGPRTRPATHRPGRQAATGGPEPDGRENLSARRAAPAAPPTVDRAAGGRAPENFDLTQAADRPIRHVFGRHAPTAGRRAALVDRPPVLFLDEPTTGLDLPSRNTLWDTIRDLVADGATVLLTTQYLEEADRLAGSQIAGGGPGPGVIA